MGASLRVRGVWQTDRAGAVRALLARLITVVAVIAGLVVLVVPLCGAGMSATPVRDVSSTSAQFGVPQVSWPMLATSSSVCPGVGVDPVVEQCGSGSSTLLRAAFGSSIPGSSGVLLACLAFLVAVLAAALGLRAPRSGRVTRPRTSVARKSYLSRPARRLTLAELCVLRT